MVKVVVLSREAQKNLIKIPRHIVLKLQDWVEDVEDRGPYYRVVKEVVEFVEVQRVDKHVY